MAQLNVRLDDDTRESFDSLARARGLSGSELIRSLIDGALGRTDPARSSADVTPRSLSAVERRLLINQYEILAALTADPEAPDGGWESRDHRRMVEVLTAGYTDEYEDMFREIRPELTERECTLVHDILQMFSTLEQSLQALSAEQIDDLGDYAERALTFGGFDFNDSQEVRLASFGRYLTRTGRWEEMAQYFDDSHERGNSHLPLLATYQRLLTAWRPLWKSKLSQYTDYLFTPAELKEILAAWPYPRSG